MRILLNETVPLSKYLLNKTLLLKQYQPNTVYRDDESTHGIGKKEQHR